LSDLGLLLSAVEVVVEVAEAFYAAAAAVDSRDPLL
jgi:hypothetical protein